LQCFFVLFPVWAEGAPMVSGRGIPGAHEANRRSGNKLAKLTKAAAAIKGDRTQNQMGGGSVLMERGGAVN
jgi:hypothetical protein